MIATVFVVPIIMFFIAGSIKGMIGIGFPAIAVALLSLLMTPTQAAALIIVPSLLTNLLQIGWNRPLSPLVKRLWPMMACICIGTFVGMRLAVGMDASKLSAILGGVLTIHGLSGLLGLRLSVSRGGEKLLAPVAGLATGAVASVTGVFVVPAMLYLEALDLSADDLMRALGLSFTVSTLALASGLAWHGNFHFTDAGLSAFFILPSIIGLAFGTFVRRHMPLSVFRTMLFVGMIAIGLYSTAASL